MNLSHTEYEKALPRWEGGADFGNETMSSFKVIISRHKKVEAEGHTWRGQVNQPVFISHFYHIVTECTRQVWGFLTCEQGRWLV